MVKFGLAFCLGLVFLHSSSAWPFKTDNSKQQLQFASAVQDQQQFAASQVNLVGDQILQAEPKVNSGADLLSVPVTEHKNYGTKGISGFLGQHKFTQQSSAQPNIILVPYYGDANDLSNSGYIDALPNLQSNATGVSKTKSRLRTLLPWNWVFLSSTSQTVESQENAQPPTQKRQWSFWPFGHRQAYQQLQPQPYQCLTPSGFVSQGVPIMNLNESPQVAYQNALSQVDSNVRQVVGSEDHNGLESKQHNQYVQSPSQAQLQQQTQQLPSIQQVSSQGNPQVTHLDVPTPNLQSVPQQVGSQVVFPNTVPYTGGNANSQSLSQQINQPANFQTSTGDVPNSQTTH